MNQIRHRGAASGWIVLVVILGVLVGLVAWSMIGAKQGTGGDQATTRPSE